MNTDEIVQNVIYAEHGVLVTINVNGFVTNDLLIVREEKARIIFNGDATIVVLEDGSKGVAKCVPSDIYDTDFGIQLAYKRAKIISLQKEINQMRRNS